MVTVYKDQFMHPLFSLIGGYMAAMIVLRARENRPANWYAVGAWAVGSAGLLWSRETLDFNLFLAITGYAGMAFLFFEIWAVVGHQEGVG
jgi:hypothetical protein